MDGPALSNIYLSAVNSISSDNHATRIESQTRLHAIKGTRFKLQRSSLSSQHAEQFSPMIVFILDFFVEAEFIQQKFGSVRDETKFISEDKHQFEQISMLWLRRSYGVLSLTMPRFDLKELNGGNRHRSTPGLSG
jgi:hypothetical protein